MARVKVEVRRGLLSPARLQSIAQNALGLYLYLLERKPFGGDCVPVAAAAAAADFGVGRKKIGAWLGELADQNLVRFHRRQYDLCVHIEKAGDHTGDRWVPVPPTHRSVGPNSSQLDRVSVVPKSGHLEPFSCPESGPTEALPLLSPKNLIPHTQERRGRRPAS